MGKTVLTLQAYAKINLALNILGKRSDGYHEVAMIMQSVSLADIVTLTEQPRDITVTTDQNRLPCDQANLAWRAADLIRRKLGIDKGVHIHLTKRIPLAAGLAGGSADGAAVLLGLNRLWGLSLNIEQLDQLGASLGSDVPFCLHGGTMLATGRGEVLTPTATLPPCYVVLAKPPVSVSTAWVYRNYRADNVISHPDIAAMQTGLTNGNLALVASQLGNVLESVTIPAHPEIAFLKEFMVSNGARAALMSGSGPTVFALVDGHEQAKALADKVEKLNMAQVFVAKALAKVEE